MLIPESLKRSALKYHLPRSRTHFHAHSDAHSGKLLELQGCIQASSSHQVTTARTIISGDTTQTLSGETCLCMVCEQNLHGWETMGTPPWKAAGTRAFFETLKF